MFSHPMAYILQSPDKRIVFAIPYEQDFTLIGTTDVEQEGGPGEVRISAAEVEYLDDIWVGYRHFATKAVKVAYPFGFGLSYTSFGYSALKLSAAEFGTGITASVTIRNTGKAAGREVVHEPLDPSRVVDAASVR